MNVRIIGPPEALLSLGNRPRVIGTERGGEMLFINRGNQAPLFGDYEMRVHRVDYDKGEIWIGLYPKE